MVRQAYRGGTIFYDVSRGYIHLEKQAGFAAPETLEAKTRFEREAQSVGLGLGLGLGFGIFAIKRDPAGEIKKHKARFCVRGDKQIEGVDYVDSYAPVVSWSTVRIMFSLTMKQGWATRQVAFSSLFV